MNIDTAKLRQFINEFFGPEDLRTFLFDYFRPVHDDLTDGLTKSRQISLLLEYCHSYKKFPDLLTAIRRERDFFQPDEYVQGQKAPPTAAPTPALITRNPRQIFISHAHQDAEVAQRLAHDLEAHGYDIWVAPDSIRPGEKWVEAINRGLEESGIFVLLLSPDAVASRWVQIETNVAISLNRQDEMQLYPLKLKTCRPPILWQAFQHISLTGNYATGFNQLLAVLNQNDLGDPGFLTGQRSQFHADTKDTSVEEEPEEEVSEFVKRIRANVRKNLEKQQPEANEDGWVHPKTGIEMVRVPAGEFLYGNEKKKLHLDEFWIAKTPVTNAEYARFVAEMKAEPPKHWQGKAPSAELADHPVVYVSWLDAKAYAEWAGMELPTEEQWEKAARGTDGREYPWGDGWRDNHCNTRESGIRQTTPVGQFSPQGDSPYGCTDMSGNVWEWTNSSTDGSPRVLCGGSWDNAHRGALVAVRDGLNPYLSSSRIGFRAVSPVVSGS